MRMMITKAFFFAVFCAVLPGIFAHAQGVREWTGRNASSVPLRRVALFSSGIAYFERSGNISGQAEIALTFDADAVNDVLQSLVINDPASASPSVRYAAENTLWRTLRSLRIDLSGMPGTVEILNGLRGAEVEVSAPGAVRGRIIGVEHRHAAVQGFPPAAEAWLSLFTPQGVQLIAVSNILSFRFVDENINADLSRALDIILSSRDDGTRSLTVALDGGGTRAVSLSYVIPAPVWKVSYRLDLSGAAPFLQGWAIVDNDSDTDWENVELSLVIGRPVSFIQNLFTPYRVFRPVLPLSIAGVAEGRAHEGGWDTGGARLMMRAAAPQAAAEQAQMWADAGFPAAVAAGVLQTAEAEAAGDQFLFTMPNPVTLQARQSAMLPLVEGNVQAERTLVFSGQRASPGAAIHPELGAELTNSSGLRLPAGPITVYDGGIFAGNALIEFFPEDERRLITFGEDLSVSGSVAVAADTHITAVTVSGGVMTITRRQSHERVYTIRNASDQARLIIIEHPVTFGAELIEPANAEDRTASLYRFRRNLAARETLVLTVREETPVSQSLTLTHLHPEIFLSYAASQEIPANVRAVLNRAIELRRITHEAAATQSQLEGQRTWLISEQDRIRRNLEAVGIQSPQGQEFLNRLLALDNEISGLNTAVLAATAETERTMREYENFLATISI